MNTKHLPLLIAIALPILFISTLALIIFIPSSQVNPQFDFVYVDKSQQQFSSYQIIYTNRYEVQNGTIVTTPIPYRKDTSLYENINYEEVPVLYRYNIKEDTSQVISFEEAQQLTLDPGLFSPDGYMFEFQYSHNGIFELFGSTREPQYYLTKDSGKKALSGLRSNRYYYGIEDIELIGWIK